MGILIEPYQELEKEYAEFAGSEHAVSCSSGTAALHLALLGVGVGKGDEVIVPDFTMAACGFAVSYTGAQPVFVDVDAETYGMSPEAMEKAITKHTKAIMVVHIYGRLADMATIIRIARKHAIPVIEDACEAQGAVRFSKAAVTCYSFYRNKIIHAEEGGIAVTDDRRIAERMRYLKNMAFGSEHDYFHEEIGYNYRLPNVEAALALKSLRQYPAHAKKRRLIESWYSKHLHAPMKDRDALWFYEARVSPEAKDEILKKIPAARHAFKPLSTFPMYGEKHGQPVAKKLSESLVLLPVSTAMIERDVRNVCDIVNATEAKYA